MESTVNKKNHIQRVARAGPVSRAVSGAALAVLACMVLAGCSKATKPKDVKYNIYIGGTHIGGDSSYNRIFIYDADSLTLIDSIPQSHFTKAIAASPDSRWLYVLDYTSYREHPTLWKIDVRTKQVAWSRSEYWGRDVRLLAGGALLLLGNDLLRSEDGSLVRHFSDSLWRFWGRESGTTVAAVAVQGDSLQHVRATDVVTGKTHGNYVPRLADGTALSLTYVRLHPDGKRILAIGIGYGFWFVVGDIETGQTLFQYGIYRPLGEIAISSDGNLAAVTGQGASAFGERGLVSIIDLRTLSFIGPTPPIPGAQVRFLPGDHRVIASPAADLVGGGPMVVIDVRTMTLERIIRLPMLEPLTGGLAVGPRE